MAYENDAYRDEEGEPLVDFDDDVRSEGEQPHDLLDDIDDSVYDRSERSPTPVFNDSNSKPRKRLIKKSSIKESGPLDFGLDDDDDDVGDVGGDYGREDDVAGLVRDDYSDGGKRKRDKGEKLRILEKNRKAEKEKKFKVRKSGGGRMKDHEADPEMKEMWDTIAGDNSEDDQEGVRTLDDDNFIDDTGVDPSDRYASDREHSPSRAPEAEEGEEDDEIKDLFKVGRKKKKTEKSPAEIALLVENVMAELEVVAEEDAELNRQGKPAINKLKKLSLLTDVLSKKQLQQEFLDHGVLTLLKNWLEPLPDGSLPNINVRAAVLKILNDFPIDLEQYDRREQLKKSGLGKVMFLSKVDEETTANRKLAKELVDKWSRPIFNKSTRFEDMKNFEDERSYRRTPVKKVMNNAAGRASRGDDDLDFSQERKSGQSSSRQHASRPEAMSMDFMVRPQSKVDPEAVRARAKQMVQDQRRAKMNKKLQQLKAPKRKQLQATKLSVEGRGMVKYL
ncbi:protein IWS1 homolog 1-like isoform X3 [Salvia miltiorrhiza]|uniref:protein IWS1 homolog 1-like isoform X3 n=1 Tax=Salvia miltiorrhiza TaxID=226208 RepID=UPI0025AC47A0|nr:protein IWS1 homolog 1-like isoform X3 [Salvia miltiorrhiza]